MDVRQKRKEFKKKQVSLRSQNLIFIDESGFRLGGTPRYGWSQRGKDAPGNHVHSQWTHMTMIGAVALDGFRGFMTIDSGTSNDVFLAFIEQQVIPNTRPGDIVVMDNLNAHKNTHVLHALKKASIDVLFTPPYSPEFNPIEKAWGKIKDILRRLNTITPEKFNYAVAKAMNSITQHDILGWVKHAGYQIYLT